MKTLSTVALATSIVALFGCGSSDGGGNETPLTTGGVPGGGGIPAAGGTPIANGGASNGGAVSAGGVVGAGGVVSAGGTIGAGGVAAAGGAGGVANTGGTVSAGGTVATGGITGSGGGTQVPDPNTVTLKMQSFTVNPGGEVYMCQNYDNPFAGQDVGLTKVATDMSPGSHHLHIFYGSTSNNRNIESCSGTEFHPLLHASGKPHGEEVYTNGMAAKLKGNMGLRLQVHYLNTTPDPIAVAVTANLTKASDPSSITKWIAELYFNRVQLSVPPGSGGKVTTSCTVPAGSPVGLIGGGSHMHSRGVHFIANTSTGVKLYETTEWSEPTAAAYDPPIMLSPGDKITWECTYNNTTGTTLTFGESAEKNEMCIYLARYYSNPNGDQMECQSVGTNGASRYRDPASAF